MRILIDWYSFTIPTNIANFELGSVHYRWALHQLSKVLDKHNYRVLFGTSVELDRGRFPYRYSVVGKPSMARLYYGQDLLHAHCQLSGVPCSYVSKDGAWGDIFSRTYRHCTRIDISADICTDVTPNQFVATRETGGFRTVGTFDSASGKSVYLGSSSSLRRAVCYRFNPPSPRAEFLRVEHRFREERAVQMAEYIQEKGLANAISHCGALFGWTHDVWQPSITEPAPLPAFHVSRKNGATMRWIETQVIPALRRMRDEEGFVRILEYLAEQLANEIEAP